MKKIHHPNIINLIDHYTSEDKFLNLIMEYCSGGSLQSLINK